MCVRSTSRKSRGLDALWSRGDGGDQGGDRGDGGGAGE